MRNSVITFLSLMLLFAVIALLAPDYAKAALGMAIGAVCWPFASKAVEIVRGQDGKD